MIYVDEGDAKSERTTLNSASEVAVEGQLKISIGQVNVILLTPSLGSHRNAY